ncbi:lipoprotein [Streptomyces sp. NPDC058613]|uniref:lipoprotein n=1 Tax=Streptomyces sp. NPDC058613 TaxID=3346556 RepID=UPI003657864A
MRKSVWAAACAAALLSAMTGCSSGSGTASSADEVWQDEIKPSLKGGTLGSRETPCALPVSFDLAANWMPKPVSNSGDPSGGFRQGPVTLVCEIDAKPSGLVGFLRVWSGPKTDGSARQLLDAFLAGEKKISDRRDRQTVVGALSAEETTYLSAGLEPDETRRERALAITTPQGTVVLHLGGLDTAEHEKLLPAYELAKNSLAVTAPLS